MLEKHKTRQMEHQSSFGSKLACHVLAIKHKMLQTLPQVVSQERIDSLHETQMDWVGDSVFWVW